MFGVIPATFLLFWVVLFVAVLLAGPPDNLEIEVTIAWWKVAAFFMAAAAAAAGCIALLFAAMEIRTPRVVIALTIGIAASVYGFLMAWDMNSYGVRQDWYWFASPVAVAALHVVAYFLRNRNGVESHLSGPA